MSSKINNHHPPARKSILTISTSQHLIGVPVSSAISYDWSKEKAAPYINYFDNAGFDLDPKDVSGTLSALRKQFEERHWDGVLVGWCTRGHVEFTELFEEIVGMAGELKGKGTKIMFSTGPNNLVETVVRNFPVDGEL